MRMSVPPGWSGHGGVVGGALALSMSHESGVTIEIWEWPRQGALPTPRPREDCDVLFVDQSAWRDVPGYVIAQREGRWARGAASSVNWTPFNALSDGDQPAFTLVAVLTSNPVPLPTRPARTRP